jgi:hypothetical protein
MRWLIEVNSLLFYDEMPLNAFGGGGGGGGRYVRISCVGELVGRRHRLLHSHH